MKKLCLLGTGLFFCFFTANTQGVHQLWGTTYRGGSNNLGVIFNMNASGDNFQRKHSFNHSTPGSYPVYTELSEYNGKLYGLAQAGGSNDKGLIFEWDPVTNAYTKKIDMASSSGSTPKGSLTLSGGKFYGMTTTGGANGYGVIFEWDPATNIYTKKIDFDFTNGSGPNGSLALSGGKFYGMTKDGGSNGNGVIFEWDPSTNVYTKKVDFNGTNGASPIGNLVLNGGKFYGMTRDGGSGGYGVIFEWDPSTNVYTKKVDFNNTNGSYPHGSLTFLGGIFYGMTQQGGANSSGVIFQWNSATNVFTKKIDLTITNGRYPLGRLTESGGKLYGMTNAGGSGGIGVIFEWNPATNIYSKKIDFNGANGRSPYGSLALSNGKIYGMTYQGGVNEAGVVFEWNPATNVYAKKIDLNGYINGNMPVGSLSLHNGKLYGMTNYGGNSDAGVIFEWDPVTDTYTKKINFDGANGTNTISGSLTLHGGKFYGMARSGGSTGNGLIFQWDPATNVFTKKIDFDATKGRNPSGSLVLYNGKFYGMTNAGGTNDVGAIFEWDPSTNTYTKKINLTLASGGYPYSGSLALHNGKFYGMTHAGGSAGTGVIFEWDPATNVYTKKIDLIAATGYNPVGTLVFKDGKFYGMTQVGGSSNYGVLFQWDPATNVFTKLVDFNSSTGTYPSGSLLLSGGKFYGMTNSGGNYNYGVVFEFDPAAFVYTKKIDFNGADGREPYLENNFVAVPALVARGLPGSCVSLPTVTIDNSNNNTWVPITDNTGNVVAEIKANGNNLGIVSASMFINNGAVREDKAKRLYLDRNLTISPQVQPSSPVDIRLYISTAEYLALTNATNSAGQSSGVNSMNDLGIFKNENDCAPAISYSANPVTTTAANYEFGYVLSASVSSFSSFYFANKAYASLPLTFLDFNGRLINNIASLNWKTEGEVNTLEFIVEKSTDGRSYSAVGSVAAKNTAGIHQYNFIDNNITYYGAPIIYYRLKQKDINGQFTYSRIIALSVNNNKGGVLLYPNPVANEANLTITINKGENVRANIVDNAGRIVMQLQWNLSAGTNFLSFDVSRLTKGIYYLELKGTTINYRKQLVKQ